MNFAKVFQFETGQLLVTLDGDYETDGVDLVMRSDTEDLSVSAKHSFSEGDKEEATKAFHEFDEEQARVKFEGFQKMMRRTDG